jgi:hypothetical protein
VSKGTMIFMLLMLALVVEALGRVKPPGFVDGH